MGKLTDDQFVISTEGRLSRLEASLESTAHSIENTMKIVHETALLSQQNTISIKYLNKAVMAIFAVTIIAFIGFIFEKILR